MDLQRAHWSELFYSTFMVGGAFHLAFGVLLLLVAIVSPNHFFMVSYGHVETAASPLRAVVILVCILAMLFLFNTAISAIGAGVFVGVRRVFNGPTDPQPKGPALDLGASG
jgi:hypothetical protein